MQTCSVTGCADPVHVKAAELCKLHYERKWRTGSTGAVGRVRAYGMDRWLGLIDPQSPGCWIWTGALDKHGYGQYDVRVGGVRKNWRAHRWVFTQLVRPLAEDETLDHLCRVHACVNPDHLEPVSHVVNVGRGNSGLHNRVKRFCPRGHEYTAENTKVQRGKWRQCLTCTRENARLAQRRRLGIPDDAVANRDKTHCKHGHEFTPENTRRTKSGSRSCIACHKAAVARYRAKQRES